MAQITFNIPNNKLNIILEAYADTYNYQITVDDGNGVQIPNPISKADFAKSIIIDGIKDVVKSYKIRVDSNSVISNANAESSNLDIT